MFIFMYSAAVSIRCGVVYRGCVGRSASSSTARARYDDDRFSETINTIVNYYFKYLCLILNTFY